MRPLLFILAYLKNLTVGRTVLWCYLIWYATMAYCYFDPSPRIWATSLGISLIIGIALMLSIASPGKPAAPDRWQIFRLFLMPFCVSSFSSLIKGRGFTLIFSPNVHEDLTALSLCAAFLFVTWALRRSPLRDPAGTDPARR
jgi:hypothetical protein